MNNRPTWKRLLLDYAIVLFAPLPLFAPLLLKGQVLFWGTPSLQFIPWWVATWHSLQQGTLPLWNPMNGMGAPLLANYQLAFFYPPNWLLLALAAIGGPVQGAPAVAWGYTFLAIVHLAWGGLGMSMLLRRMGFSWLGQVLGGLAYGLSGYVVGRLGFFSMVWVAAWLPWIIFFADRIDPTRFRLIPGLVACFAMQLLAGHAQLTWYTILLTGGWVAYKGLREPNQAGRWRRLGWSWLSLGAAVLLAAGIAAVQLIPTFEYLRMSHRADAVAYEDAMVYSFWPWRIITLFSPDFFGSPASGNYWGYVSYWEDHLYTGLLPLILALSTFWLTVKGFWRSKRDAHWGLLLFLWIGLVATFLLAFGKNTPIFPFLYKHVPTFAMFQAPARYLLWAAFAIPVLTAVGIEHWRCPTGKGLYWFHLGTAGAFAVTLGAGLASILLQNIRLTFIRASALTGMWALGFGLLTLAIPYVEKKGLRRFWQWSVIVWTLADLLVTGWSLNPGIGANFYAGQSDANQRLEAVPSGQRVYLSQQEETELKFKRFLRFKDFSPLEGWRGMRDALIPDLNLLDGISLVTNFDPLSPDHYNLWVNALETLSPDSQQAWLAWMGVGAVEHIDAGQPAGVRYDLLSGSQRWHWYNCARYLSTPEQVWQAVQAELDQPPQSSRALLIEGHSGAVEGSCQAGGMAAIVITQDRNDHVALTVDAADAGFVELMDTWYPGWTARIDGVNTTIYQADGMFRAVMLPKGKHQIEFLYRPSGFYFGALFSILVMLFVLILWLKWGRNSTRRTSLTPKYTKKHRSNLWKQS